MRLTATTASLALTRTYGRCCCSTYAGLASTPGYRVGTARGIARSPSSTIMLKRQVSSSSASSISSKIQVLPFQVMPSKAVRNAEAFTTAVILSDRVGNGMLKGIYQLLRASFGLSSKFMWPRTVRWQAIYLPLWKLDHLINLKARFSGLEYDVELSSQDSNIVGTAVEPLASTPPLYPPSETWSDALENFSSETHLKLFNQEDLPESEEQVKVSPITVPFSLVLPSDLEKIHRDVVSDFRDDEVRFTGDVKNILQVSYPLYMPFYLVDIADNNVDYPDESATCLVWGGNVPSGPTPASLFRNGSWIDKQSDQLDVGVHMYPNTSTTPSDDPDDASDAAKNPASPAAFLFRKMAEAKGIAAIKECLPKILVKMKESCTRLDSDISLEAFSKKIEGLKWVMNFKETAEANRAYADAVSEARTAEHEVQAAKALPGFPSDIKGRVPVFMSGAGMRGFKFMNAEEAAQARLEMIEAAEKKAEKTKEALRDAIPSWLRE